MRRRQTAYKPERVERVIAGLLRKPLLSCYVAYVRDDSRRGFLVRTGKTTYLVFDSIENATKFRTRADAEAAFMILSAQYPEYIGKGTVAKANLVPLRLVWKVRGIGHFEA